ncbi:hypothetical protein ABPG72_000573 [Tetrahymena utriculariae]
MSQVDNNISSQRVKEHRPASVRKEYIQRNLSETKFAVKTDSQKFSFKNYVKTQIQKENQMNEKLDKTNNKSQQLDYVQQLIDLKLQIQKTSFLHLYKKKYIDSQQEKIHNIKDVKIPVKTQEILNAMNTSQSIHNLNNKIQNHIDQVNQKINQKLEIQQKSQFIGEQIPQQKNNNNLLAKDLLERKNSNNSVFIQKSINMQFSATENAYKINYNDIQKYQSLNIQNMPEIQKIEEGNTDLEVQLIKKQKQSENQEIQKKQINTRQIIQTQNTIEDDESCSSSGEEFDLNLLPKSRLIFKINKTSQCNYQSVPNQSRQSVDSNYNHVYQKFKQGAGVDEECQQNNSNSGQNKESISSKLKQIVAKRKFASENIQSQHIKNLHKLMPHAFEKVEKNQQSVSRSPIKSQQRQILFEVIKALNSQESTNQNFPISSEETDIDLNEANTQTSTKQNQFFSAPSIKKEFIADQNTEKCSEKAKFIVKGRPSKFVKQVRSQSVNNNKYQNQNNQSQRKIQYPIINILLCSTKNENLSEVQKNLTFSQTILECQEKIHLPSSLNSLSNQLSNKDSNDPSPTSNSNLEAPSQKPLSKENSSDAINTKKKQTIKLGNIKHLLTSNPAKNKKDKFINYHLVLKESNQKEFLNCKHIPNQFRNRCSTTSLKSYLLDNTSKEILENNQKNINSSLNNPTIVQSLQSASFKNFSQHQKQNQQYFSENSQMQQAQLLCPKKISLKQVNFSNILDISSIENEVQAQKIAQ